jgi:nucleotide-binding universal stress UspA family protein
MANIAAVTSTKSSQVCPEPRAPAIAHVLVCLDRSAFSDACLPYARFVADAFGANVTLLHVMPSPDRHEPNRADALGWEIAQREAEHYLSHAKNSLGANPPRAVTQLTQGFPAERIVGVAREIGADLTILASRGEGGEWAPDLGSTAQRVLGLAVGSILLTRATSSARIPPNRILVPLDGSPRGECVLPLVVDLVRLHGAEVLLAHVVTEPTSTAVLSDARDMQLAVTLASRLQEKAERYLSVMRDRLLAEIGAVETLVVRRPEERQALVDVAAQYGADMLALTAHGSTCNVERRFGSVASFLLAHARIPIFVLQDMPQGPLEREPRRVASVAPAALEARTLEWE